jgi:hypothetical protein
MGRVVIDLKSLPSFERRSLMGVVFMDWTNLSSRAVESACATTGCGRLFGAISWVALFAGTHLERQRKPTTLARIMSAMTTKMMIVPIICIGAVVSVGEDGGRALGGEGGRDKESCVGGSESGRGDGGDDGDGGGSGGGVGGGGATTSGTVLEVTTT